MADQIIEAMARSLCEQHIRRVRQHDTDPAELDAMIARCVDYAWPEFTEQAQAAYEAYQAHLTAAGLCVVPVEATEEMVRAAQDDIDDGVRAVDVYRAMIEARP